jgi:hypothetical protein
LIPHLRNLCNLRIEPLNFLSQKLNVVVFTLLSIKTLNRAVNQLGIHLTGKLAGKDKSEGKV